MPELNLIAFDADDLAVISAHLQDAVLKVGDIAYLPRERRFAAVGNRFDWTEALKAGNRRPPEYMRRQAALRFERVLAAKLQGIDLSRKSAILSLLAISFEPGAAPENPGGQVVLRSTISREQALIAHTRSNAYFLFQEGNIGSLTSGRYADLLVLDRDYLTVPAGEIKSIKPLLTMVGGKVVHDVRPN